MADRRRRRKVDGSEESEEFSDSSGDDAPLLDTTPENISGELITSGEVTDKEPVGAQGESEYESVEEDERVMGAVDISEKMRDMVVHDGLRLDATTATTTDTDNPVDEEGGEEGTADMLDGDCLDDDEDDDDWKEGQREEGDGEESEILNKEKVLDFDEDRRNPQYIPKKGGFYEHDDRLTEEAAAAVEVEDPKKKGKKKLWKDEGKWMHDRYQDGEQTPKSHDELVTVYGYDIRNEDGPPRARRRRRYGRGPSKYTRKWDDEDAYAKILPPRTGGNREDVNTPDSMNGPRGGGGRGVWRDRGPRRGGRGFRGGGGGGGGGGYRMHRDEEDEEWEGESGGDHRERRLREDDDSKEWPALGNRPQEARSGGTDHDDRSANRNRRHQPRDDGPPRGDRRPPPRDSSEERPDTAADVRHHPLEQPREHHANRRDDGNAEPSFVQRRGRGSRGRGLRNNHGQPPRGRGGYAPRGQLPIPTDRDLEVENEGPTAEVQPPAPADRGGLVQQMEALDVHSSSDSVGDGGNFTTPKESRREAKVSSSQAHGAPHDRRQATIPPRLQDAVNRTKRYSSQRQRPVPDNVPYQGGAPPPPHGAPSHGAPASMPPRFYDTGYQQPIYPDHGPPANVQQGGGVLISPQPYPFDPSFQEAYVAGVRTMASPPRIFSSPVTLAAGQPGIPAPYIAPTGNMMNYGPPPVPVTYQQIPYQQYPVPPPQVVVPQGDPLKSTLTALQPQPHEIFRGGMAYYNAQPPVRTLPNKRPRAAIPIVPPPEMEVHRREDYEDMRDSGDVDSPTDEPQTESQSAVPASDVEQ